VGLVLQLVIIYILFCRQIRALLRGGAATRLGFFFRSVEVLLLLLMALEAQGITLSSSLCYFPQKV